MTYFPGGADGSTENGIVAPQVGYGCQQVVPGGVILAVRYRGTAPTMENVSVPFAAVQFAQYQLSVPSKPAGTAIHDVRAAAQSIPRSSGLTTRVPGRGMPTAISCRLLNTRPGVGVTPGGSCGLGIPAPGP